MEFDTRTIKEESKRDFRKAWMKTSELIPASSKASYSGGAGKPHPMHEMVQKTRQVFLKLGFEEVENQVFIPEEDVYKQYGPEAPVILDRCYYLAGLPRPDIGLSDEKTQAIKNILTAEDDKSSAKKRPIESDIDAIKFLFRRYREGAVEGDNMVEELVKRLRVKTEAASQILSLFPEFRNIQPQASSMTLRSHMTAAWFPTLAAMQDVYPLPLRLFSVGMRFRREQKVDASHLRAHYGGSCVIMDEDVSLEAGKKLTEKILNGLEFGDITFRQKTATSNYYAPDTEFEVYSGDIEVADIGMYSPVALANYDIKHNVFNLGFGLERILMVKHKIGDIREVLYPQFYGKLELSDKEIAADVKIDLKPSTAEGRAVSKAIVETALRNADAKSPCEYQAYGGMVGGRKVEVNVVEREDNTLLLGPAALNEVYVHDGNVYGLPKDTSKLKSNMAEVQAKGVRTGLAFIQAVADYAAAKIEEAAKSGGKDGVVQFKMAKAPSDVNMVVGGKARRFIQSHNKAISIKGPVFTTVEFKIL